MDESKRELVRAWLTKAQHDLATARKIVSGDDPYFDTAVYHCQQGAEKAIKGFLVYHDQRFPKSHDLRLLVQEAAGHDPAFVKWDDAADLLTPMATTYGIPALCPTRRSPSTKKPRGPEQAYLSTFAQCCPPKSAPISQVRLRLVSGIVSMRVAGTHGIGIIVLA